MTVPVNLLTPPWRHFPYHLLFAHAASSVIFDLTDQYKQMLVHPALNHILQILGTHHIKV